MEERIIKLETLSALQDETIRQLSQELFRQQRDTARLRAQLEELKAKIAQLEEPDPIAPGERPPHY